MKKFFDRYLFSRMGLQIIFCILAIMLLSMLLTYMKNTVTANDDYSSFEHLSWGFRQLADSGTVTKTLEELDQIRTQKSNALIVLVLALMSWIVGIILCGFITGAIVNAFDGRKYKIKSGQTRYSFKNHGLIIGWDFQGVAAVRNLFENPEWGITEVLIVSDMPTEEIFAILDKALDAAQLRHVYIYNCSVNVDDNIKILYAERAKVILLLGEQTHLNKDGETLHTERILQEHVREKIKCTGPEKYKNLPIKLYMHLDDTVLYTQARAKEDGFVEDEIFDIELCNFYESWAWRCWSKIGATDHDPATTGKEYLPLRYKKNSERVELFVIGFDAMAQAMINYVIPLLNYGETGKHCRITLFDVSDACECSLPKRQLVESLPEVEIVYKRCSGGSNEANDIMYEAIMREDTSVTIIIAEPEFDAAVKIYASLSYQIRHQNISVLVRQSTTGINCMDKALMQNGADCVELRYFGMTDILPWMDPTREEYGREINYSYGVVCNAVRMSSLNQVETPGKFLEVLRLALDFPYGEQEKEQAAKEWCGIKRWQRWSSINAGDCFKEKLFAFPDCTANAETCISFLRAEHNRWWTERLMAGWRFAEKKDKKRYLHSDLVEFEKLSAEIQAYDLLSIVAMRNAGLLK